ncbi:hypothetical protein L873DRAFT_595972 [Choiromyces venosus 120613-1]|uniref:Uncharacterized protein n=1 Tax=Choiromyces venosus 120613-1 TaxID=1336337 RepID=A0A3N4JWX9_9PEZI|nr:hypothetical protein L873DRAFT_595972 [Choiromyces venosus 120613-1]
MKRSGLRDLSDGRVSCAYIVRTHNIEHNIYIKNVAMLFIFILVNSFLLNLHPPPSVQFLSLHSLASEEVKKRNIKGQKGSIILAKSPFLLLWTSGTRHKLVPRYSNILTDRLKDRERERGGEEQETLAPQAAGEKPASCKLQAALYQSNNKIK